jgi:hypothetical protein
MFLDNSRYVRTKRVDVTLKDGRTVTAVSLRRLPTVPGEAVVVQGNNRLDIMAQRRYGDPTQFWHIADANPELQAGDLVKVPNRVIKEPTQ